MTEFRLSADLSFPPGPANKALPSEAEVGAASRLCWTESLLFLAGV